jgi:hypothetical protein
MKLQFVPSAVLLAVCIAILLGLDAHMGHDIVQKCDGGVLGRGNRRRRWERGNSERQTTELLHNMEQITKTNTKYQYSPQVSYFT